MRDNTRYANAVGRIRVLEKKQLDKNQFDRMLEAKTAEDAFKTVLDAGYSLDEDNIKAWDFERVLEKRINDIYDYLKKISPDKNVVDVFLCRHDYHNAKVILKTEFSGQNESGPYLDAGTISFRELEMLIRERKLDKLPSILGDAVEKCIENFGKNTDPQEIDFILDNAMFRHMSCMASSIHNDFIVKLIKIIVDLINIRTFVRVKLMKKSDTFLNKVLFDYGSIPISRFISQFDKTLESFVVSMKSSDYADLCAEGINEYIDKGTLTKLEKLGDNYILSYLRSAKYIALGAEPLVAYLFAYENEIKNIRIIMVGKINKIPNDVIMERLRDVYV